MTDYTWVAWDKHSPVWMWGNENAGTVAHGRERTHSSSFLIHSLFPNLTSYSWSQSRSNCPLFSSLDPEQRKHHGALAYFLIATNASQSSTTCTEKCFMLVYVYICLYTYTDTYTHTYTYNNSIFCLIIPKSVTWVKKKLS